MIINWKLLKNVSPWKLLILDRYTINRPISQSGRVFVSGPRDLGSISGRVIPKTQKMVLDISLLNTQHYKVPSKGKVEQSKERSSALPTPRYSSYWKGSLRAALDYGRQLYFCLYLKPYNYVQTNDYYLMRIVTWKHITPC